MFRNASIQTWRACSWYSCSYYYRYHYYIIWQYFLIIKYFIIKCSTHLSPFSVVCKYTLNFIMMSWFSALLRKKLCAKASAHVHVHMCMCLDISDSSSIVGPVGETAPHDTWDKTHRQTNMHTSPFAVSHNALLWLWLQLPSGYPDLCEANVSW